jgi:ferrochelatase
VRAYLAEFLSDPLVVALPRFLWLPILYGIVLRSRPAKSAEKYRMVWTDEGSPLAVHTARQTRLLAAKTGWRVEYAMRYGAPSVPSVLKHFRENPVVVPLYPQYSRSTTETVFRLLPPGTRTVRDFHAHPGYIAALASSIERYWSAQGRGDRLVMSFHGLPQRAVDLGDPYQAQCLATAGLVAGKLGLQDGDYLVTFQSRFGAAKWLQPYTEPTLIELAGAGLSSVDVVCPGFVSDCLETLEEINIGARHAFLAAGGKRFAYIPCLNESPEWIEALAAISAG